MRYFFSVWESGVNEGGAVVGELVCDEVCGGASYE